MKNIDDFGTEHSQDTSKSQRKRELNELRETAEQLVKLSPEKIRNLGISEITEAVLEGKRISKGNARKRHVQYIAKLIRKRDPEEIDDLIKLFDPQSVRKGYRKLESWRSRLLTDQGQTFSAIVEEHPSVDRQHLQQLVRKAKAEQENEKIGSNQKKLFQFLRGLTHY